MRKVDTSTNINAINMEKPKQILVYFDEIGHIWMCEEKLREADLLEKKLMQVGSNVCKQVGKFILFVSFFAIEGSHAREIQKTVFPIDIGSDDSTDFDCFQKDYRPTKFIQKKVQKVIKPLFRPDGKLVELIQNYAFLKNIEPVIHLVDLTNYRTNFKTIILPKFIDMSLTLPYQQVIPTASLPFSLAKLLKTIRMIRGILILSGTTLAVIKYIKLRGGAEIQENQEIRDYQKGRNRIRLIRISVFLTGSILLLGLLIYYGLFDIHYFFAKEEYELPEIGANDPIPELKQKFLQKLGRFLKDPKKKEELTKMSRGFEDYKQKYLDAILKM